MLALFNDRSCFSQDFHPRREIDTLLYNIAIRPAAAITAPPKGTAIGATPPLEAAAEVAAAEAELAAEEAAADALLAAPDALLAAELIEALALDAIELAAAELEDAAAEAELVMLDAAALEDDADDPDEGVPNVPPSTPLGESLELTLWAALL